MTDSGEKGCITVPCPSFTEQRLTIIAVCNCYEQFRLWGNPWGDPSCPVHGDDVRERIAQAAR